MGRPVVSPMTIPDETLRALVLEALASNRDAAALDLRVGVLNAVVHLGGEAPSAGLRDRAETIAAAIAGVRGVVNRIEAPGAPSPARTIHIPLAEQEREEP